jgi:hypothetical protein
LTTTVTDGAAAAAADGIRAGISALELESGFGTTASQPCRMTGVPAPQLR